MFRRRGGRGGGRMRRNRKIKRRRRRRRIKRVFNSRRGRGECKFGIVTLLRSIDLAKSMANMVPVLPHPALQWTTTGMS